MLYRIIRVLTLFLSFLSTFVLAQLQTNTQQVNPFNEFMAPEGGIDLLSGVSSFPQKIYTLSGRGGMDVVVTLKYSSNVMFNVKASNDIAPTSWVGLGWSMGYGSITCEHNGTPAHYDDKYYWTSPEGLRKEIIPSGTTFYLESNPYWKIKKIVDPTHTNIIRGWILYDTDGKKYKYGDLDDEFDRNATRYTFAWTHHVGEGWNFADASFKRYPDTWDLATIEDVYGNGINFIYEQIEEKVIHKSDNSGDSLYTKASYLIKIINPEGAEIVFVTDKKNEDEYTDPYSLLPEPDGLMELFEDKYLKKIFAKNQYGETLREFLFCYSAINKRDEIGEELGNKKYEKRLLTQIVEKNGDGKKLSSFAFEYFDVIDSTEGFPDYDTNYNYGALKTIRSSMCGKIDFNYERETYKIEDVKEGEMHSLSGGYDNFHYHDYLHAGRLPNGTYYHVDFAEMPLYPSEPWFDSIPICIRNLTSAGTWKSYTFYPQGFDSWVWPSWFKSRNYKIKYGEDYVLFILYKDGEQFYWLYQWDGEKWIEVNGVQKYHFGDGNAVLKTYAGKDYIVGLIGKYSGSGLDYELCVLNYNRSTKSWHWVIQNEDLNDHNHEKWVYCGDNYFVVKGGNDGNHIWVYNRGGQTGNWTPDSDLWKYRETYWGHADDFKVYPGKNFFVLRGGYKGESLWFFNWDGTKWIKTKSVGASDEYGNNERKAAVLGDNYVVMQGGNHERKIWAFHWNGNSWVKKLKAKPNKRGSKRDNSLYGGNNYIVKVTGKHRHLQ